MEFRCYISSMPLKNAWIQKYYKKGACLLLNLVQDLLRRTAVFSTTGNRFLREVYAFIYLLLWTSLLNCIIAAIGMHKLLDVKAVTSEYNFCNGAESWAR